jgi:hypothetical protein
MKSYVIKLMRKYLPDKMPFASKLISYLADRDDSVLAPGPGHFVSELN